MDLSKSNALHKIQSRIVSKEMFDFDKLSARPLLSMLDYSDLDKLYNIASSIRYSGDIQKKLNAIREVMHNRGFRKLAQGTNRIVYSYFEDPSIVIKIATDRVGMKDNPAEFMNQHLLKPFVTKVFEVTPDGVVGEFERVEPITSREEFLSCANDYYDLLNIITKKYIIADVGSNTFMNVGIRKNFGCTILDFSYVFEPDCNKLVCSAPNYNEPSGICGGFIDYDAGFNNLICTKCGVIYKAQEIAKGVEENKIIRKGRKSKMKVAVNWKEKKEVKEINLDGQLGGSGIFKPATSIVRPSVSNEPVGKLKIATPVVSKVVKEVAVSSDTVKVIEEKKEEVVEETPVVEEKVVVSPFTVEEPKTIADPATALETIEKLEKEIHTPQPERKVKVADDKKKGLKLKVTNQDGTTTEKAVDSHTATPQKNTGVKVKDNRHYKNNYGDLPRRSQIQLTAITFEQLKELDFKYSSTDLEYHKMFFRAEHEKSNPSVSVDFDSIPKDKLLLVAGIDDGEVDDLKAELEKAKSDLNETEEALITLRKLGSNNNAQIDSLKAENNKLREEIRDDNERIAVLEADNSDLIHRLKEAEAKLKELETREYETVKQSEEVIKENTVESNTDTIESSEFDTEKITFISGMVYKTHDICEALGEKVPDNLPSDLVVAFNLDNDDANFIQDQDGKTICVAWLNDVPLDNIQFSIQQENTK